MKALKKLLAAALVAALPLAAMAQDKPAEDTIKVTPYGFVLLNAYFGSGNGVKEYPGAATALDPGSSFLGSARQSRFGVKLAGADTVLTGATLSGVIEFDFNAGWAAGANAASTNWYNGLMRLRLAAATASWKFDKNTFSLLAGQEYGLVNPLFADSLAWAASPLFWQAGNLWRRSPQVRATFAGSFGDVGLNVAAAILSPADGFTGAPHAIDLGAGNASGMPDLEARAALSAKFGDIGGTVGVGYHTEKRKYLSVTGTTVNTDDELTTSLIGVDVDLALTKYLGVKGEYYMGKGSDDTYFGIAPAIDQSAAAVGSRELAKSSGFWVQASAKPVPALTINVGYGKASADDDAIVTAGTRQENAQLAIGAFANAGKFWRFGLEFCQVTTTYDDGAGGTTDESGSIVALSSRLTF